MGVKKVQFRRRFTTSLLQVYYKFGAVLAQFSVSFRPVFVAKLRGRGREEIVGQKFDKFFQEKLDRYFVRVPRVLSAYIWCGHAEFIDVRYFCPGYGTPSVLATLSAQRSIESDRLPQQVGND